MTDDIFSSVSADRTAKMLFLFEKEKGGTGSTGSLMSVAHSYITRSVPIVLVEASLTQEDVLAAYGGHQRVEKLDLLASDAQDRLIDTVYSAPPGSRILANIPGGRIEEVEGLHDMLIFAQRSELLPIATCIVWTMGLDIASGETLQAVLDGELPGPLVVNMPRWHGEIDAFENIDGDVLSRVEAIGGGVIQMPPMPKHLYDKFRKHSIAPDRLPSPTIGERIARQKWTDAVIQNTGHIFV